MADSKIERGRFHPSFQLTGTAPDGFLAVTLDTAKEGFVKVAVAGDKFLGILSERGPKAEGEAVGVFTEGNIIAVYSDTVAVGDILEIGAGGKLVPQDEGEGVAIALENGIAGETHQVKLQYTSAPASA